ncbi:MAG: DUF3857 domain-containing transglutaminase family protein [Verrucomicrobiaceae bacterium]
MPEFAPNDLHRNPDALRGTRLKVEPAPDWVVRRKVKNIGRIDGFPVTMLLLDRQINPDSLVRYTRYVRRLETPQAVQDAGRIEMDFDPATQTLLVHAISIFRNGELTNYANLEDINIIQRERDLEKGIYAGSITALILLKDVRTGDVIDIETSVSSDDAIFPSHYWFTENFEHTLPVGHQYFSWISQNQERFKVSTHPKDTLLEEEETTWGVRKTWSRESASVLDLPPLLPLGYNPFEHLSLTTFQSWKEVAAEVALLWERTEKPGPDLPSELQTLQTQHPDSPVALIEAIVAFVRDNIRYQGVEIGRLGLVPEELHTIWERRFGDCKEKTSLLCWMLRESGFDAHPALVSTALRGRITDHLPAPIFDHVVVYLNHDEQDYWIDPTVISQRGSLDSWTSLPFEKALLISDQTEDFIQIAEPPPGRDLLKVHEHYRFQGRDATLAVKHEYSGAEADGVRGVLDSNGRTAIQQIFSEIVKSTRSQAELKTDLEVADDPARNIITLQADFTIKDALTNANRGNTLGCEFVPHSIVGKISGIDQQNRTMPLALNHPFEVEHSTRVEHPDAKGAIVPKTIINNEFLEFEAGTRDEKTKPTIYYRYRSKAPEIPIDQLHRYRLNLDQIGSVISLIFETRTDRRSKTTLPSSSRNWQDEELDPEVGHQYRPRSQPTHHRSGPPVWVYVVFGLIGIRILALIIRLATER